MADHHIVPDDLPLSVAVAIVREYENLEGVPGDAFCGYCNMGAGPHYRPCVYHLAQQRIEDE